VWNRFALTILEKFKSIEYLTSIFIIPCSIFDIRFFKVYFPIRPATITRTGEIAVKNRSHNPKQPIQNYKVFFRLGWPFVWPAAGLTPKTLKLIFLASNTDPSAYHKFPITNNQ